MYLYVSQSSPKIIVLCLWTALAVIAPADYFRLRYPAFERFYERGVGFLMRESERVRWLCFSTYNDAHTSMLALHKWRYLVHPWS